MVLLEHARFPVTLLNLVAVPASAGRDVTPAARGLKHRSKAQKRNPLIIQQTVVEQSITIVQNQNLGAISQLAQIAEAEFAALVQSQAALTTQLEQVKNNIRVNHFKARFSQVVSPLPSPGKRGVPIADDPPLRIRSS